jgi:hypothetical protein
LLTRHGIGELGSGGLEFGIGIQLFGELTVDKLGHSDPFCDDSGFWILDLGWICDTVLSQAWAWAWAWAWTWTWRFEFGLKMGGVEIGNANWSCLIWDDCSRD